MINHRYDPSEKEDRILEVVKNGGPMRQKAIAEELDESTANINYYIHRLVAAGWLTVPEEAWGVYEFRCDPREMDNSELANLFRKAIADLQ